MKRFLFVRHTAHDYLAKGIAGRQPGVHLNDSGRKKAEAVGDHLACLPINAIYSSPLERARETAEPLARKLGIDVQLADEFNEVDMGAWTGRTFLELDSVPQWKQWNAFRSSTRPPNGESMLEVQQRVLQKLGDIPASAGLVLIVSHGDVIRAIVVHYLGLHLDLLHRIEVDPGGLSLIELGQDWARVRCVNSTADGATALTPIVCEDTTAC